MDEKIDLSVYAPVCEVKIENTVLPTDAILSVSIDENLDSPAKFDITLNEEIDIKKQKFVWLESDQLTPGNKVEINFGYTKSGSECIFKGTIKALTPNFPADGVPTLTIEGYDPSHTMQKKYTKVNDLEVKYSDIVKELAQKNNIETNGSVKDTQKKYPKVARQKGEKDYKFLRRLADEAGFECFVQSGKLYFRESDESKDDNKVIKNFQYRKNIISFSPRLSIAKLVKEVVVTGWNKDAKEPIKINFDLMSLGSNPDIKALEDLIKKSEGKDPLVIEHKTFKTEDEAMDIAKVTLKNAMKNFIQGALECIGDTKLRPGKNIKITGIANIFNGYYYITSARHSFGSDGYRTSLDVRRNLL